MTPPFKNIHVVINPAAGKNEPVLNLLNDVFRRCGVAWNVSLTHQYGDGSLLARKAVTDGADLVVAYGGDGTVMNVANGLMGADVPLGILPGGTANAFAVEMGIPRNLKRAVELLCREDLRLKATDVGKIGGQFFLLRADMGSTATLSAVANREMKDRYGMLAYFAAAVRALRNPQRGMYRMTVDGFETECEGIACVIANVGTVGALNLSLSSAVDPGDGMLDVFVLGKGMDSLVGVMTHVVADLIRLKEIGESLLYCQAQAVSIEASLPQDVHIDGEDYGRTPVSASVLPGALRVVVPGG